MGFSAKVVKMRLTTLSVICVPWAWKEPPPGWKPSRNVRRWAARQPEAMFGSTKIRLTPRQLGSRLFVWAFGLFGVGAWLYCIVSVALLIQQASSLQ